MPSRLGSGCIYSIYDIVIQINMLEDVLLIADKHREVAAGVVEEVMKQITPKFVIAISGESGSGKSELTHLIAKGLLQQGVVAKPIHIDNFYKTLPLERTAIRKAGGVEKTVGWHEYDWEKIHQVMDDFRAGRESTMPCVDLVTQRVDRLTTDFAPVNVLVIDGLYAMKTPGINLALFIELTYHETKKAQSGRGKENVDAFRFEVLEAEHKAVQALREKAHWLVNKDYKLVRA